MTHFLQVHGIIDAVLKAAAVALFGAAVKAVRKLVRAHLRVLREIEELLRTDTPGGLGDVAEKQDRLLSALEKPAPRARKTPAKPRADGEGRG